MEENRIRTILAQKLTAYRKRAGMTQAELAEKLNYSDKSVSKWERGDGMPDLLVLCQLADLYDVPLDAFLREGPLVRSQREQRSRHAIITLLSLGLVVFVSAIAFFVCHLAQVKVGWLSFVYAVPVCMILLVVFSHIWGNTLHQAISVTLLDWTLCASVYISFRAISGIQRIEMLFMVAAVFQVLIILWYVLMYVRRRNRTRKGGGNVLS
ncbi:MAG: helix-turn-helix transcriptional regulator [Clostridia bacterium]|jgi:transcriptional regulator with XRE-family HTH domain|nr:helix-turn-helix transcriptional regulator [Clostridia bacterium]MBR0436891.1 helix-turn-helix transcriptional regulator [Clostridia bacterium]